MKSQWFRVAATSIILFGMALPVSAQQETASNTRPQLTMAEVAALSARAKTAEDHEKLATYFRDEAREAENMAEVHEKLLKAYATNPVTGAKTELTEPCREVVENSRKAAASATKMAEAHEAIAERLQQNATK